MKVLQRRERRNKLEIYFAILNAIKQEVKNVEIVRPTRVQFLSNLSYDNTVRYLNELKEKKLVQDSNEISLTSRGESFLRDYEKIRKFTEQMGLDYL